MPFKSKKQMRWMFATHPKMAKKWAEHTPDAKSLPEDIEESHMARKHLRHLLELFLPEARFPDEKFWSKSGDPIHPKPKGPGGAHGTSAKDYGFHDPPTAPVSSPTPARGDLYDHFSKSENEFIRAIRNAAYKLYGTDFESVIDDSWGKPGMVKDLLEKMWKNNFTDYEALGEIGFLFDIAQNGNSGYQGYLGPSHYPAAHTSGYHPREDWDPNTGDMIPRPGRPKGGDRKGNLVY
jgi:hypothetical protein